MIKYYSYTFKILSIEYSENHYMFTLKQMINPVQTEVSDAKPIVIMKTHEPFK